MESRKLVRYLKWERKKGPKKKMRVKGYDFSPKFVRRLLDKEGI